jgi:hypothetical protein
VKIFAGSDNYVPKATTKTIHSGPGKIHHIIISTDGTGLVTFYDNTAGSGTKLLELDCNNILPLDIQMDKLLPLVFTVGLTITTSANARCFVITEA